MFALDRFVDECRTALGSDRSHGAIREIVAQAVSEPGTLLRALGEPQHAGIQPLHRSETLTVLNVIWAPNMTLPPHDHRMWAVIGIYTGREDNIFWRRVPGDASKVEAAGAKALCAKDAEPLGHRIIHSVTNPIPRYTGAIHVYGGDFFGALRSEWDAESLVEGSWDTERTMRRFEEANARFDRRSTGG
jgi:predicted metal-dependent enzyme (double-stranded beta helix superfamily)